MNTIFRGMAFLVAIFCLTWIGVVWHWQRTGRDVAVADVVAYLIVLPVVIAVLAVMLRSAWGSAVARSAAANAATPRSEAAAKDSPDSNTSADRAQLEVQLVHVAVCTAAGTEAADVLDAALAGQPMPRPDAALTNDSGLPVLCARIDDASLQLETTQAELATLLPTVRQRQPEWQSTEPGEHVIRALSALREPALAQHARLYEHAQATRRNPGHDESTKPNLPSIRVLIGCSSRWSTFEQALARAWVERVFSAAEADLSSAYTLSYAVVAGAGEELWSKATQIFEMHATGTRTDWLLLLGCHSDIDQTSVELLAQSQRLYDSTDNPSGVIPGEAGVALLLAPLTWMASPEVETASVSLRLPIARRRETSIEMRGRITHSALGDTVARALTAAECASTEVGAVVCDADQHSSRAPELYGLTIDLLPHLDPIEDLRALGKVTGHTGPASYLLVIATASDWVKQTGKEQLALGMADGCLRMATLIKPRKDQVQAT